MPCRATWPASRPPGTRRRRGGRRSPAHVEAPEGRSSGCAVVGSLVVGSVTSVLRGRRPGAPGRPGRRVRRCPSPGAPAAPRAPRGRIVRPRPGGGRTSRRRRRSGTLRRSGTDTTLLPVPRRSGTMTSSSASASASVARPAAKGRSPCATTTRVTPSARRCSVARWTAPFSPSPGVQSTCAPTPSAQSLTSGSSQTHQHGRGSRGSDHPFGHRPGQPGPLGPPRARRPGAPSPRRRTSPAPARPRSSRTSMRH